MLLKHTLKQHDGSIRILPYIYFHAYLYKKKKSCTSSEERQK